MKRRRLLALTGGALTATAGCMGLGGGGGQDFEPAVTITNPSRSFDPLIAEVAAGEGVAWENPEDATQKHEIISSNFSGKGQDWDFRQMIEPGETAKHLFEESGVYEYYCGVHTQTVGCGAVVVGDAGGNYAESDLICQQI